jgi:adenine-specific DNA-methyltransferase
VGNYVNDGAIVPLDILAYETFTERGLTLRNRIVWTFGHGLHCTRRLSHRYETVLWFTRGDDYTFNLDALRIPQLYPQKKYYKGPRKGQLSGNPLGKNPGDVWAIPNVKHNHPDKLAHPCQFPVELARRLVVGMTPEGGTVLDPFCGSGSTGVAVARLGGRFNFVGIDINPVYVAMAKAWIRAEESAHCDELESERAAV